MIRLPVTVLPGSVTPAGANVTVVVDGVLIDRDMLVCASSAIGLADGLTVVHAYVSSDDQVSFNLTTTVAPSLDYEVLRFDVLLVRFGG